MKKQLLIALLILTGSTIYSQRGIGTVTPSTEAVLHLASVDSTKGLIIPTVTTAKRPIATSSINGMLVYNVTDSCVQLCDGTKWFCLDEQDSLDADWNININGTGLEAAASGNNIASGSYAIAGGDRDTASANNSVVAGGFQNKASGIRSFVGGGEGNKAIGISSVVSGGYRNIASNHYSTVSGGYRNEVDSVYGVVAGGHQNKASYYYSVISGGANNISSNNYSTVSGGRSNVASGTYSFVGGRSDTASGNYSVVVGGYQNKAFGTLSFIGSGEENKAIGTGSVISGGIRNMTSGDYSVITGGNQNISQGYASFTGSGLKDSVMGNYSSIVGGENNAVFSNHSVIAGGSGNKINGSLSNISGGATNNTFGNYSTVSGGRDNTAQSYGEWVGGLYSTNYAPASTTTFNATDRLFNIGNGTTDLLRSDAFTILKNGNTGIGTSLPQSNLHVRNTSSASQLIIDNLSGGNSYGGRISSFGNTNRGLIFETKFNSIYDISMVINNLGNVGIGTTTPTHKLDVNGEARIRTITDTTATLNVLVANANGVVKKIHIDSIKGAEDADFFKAGTASAPTSINDSIYTMGNVGIGTNNPVFDLQIDKNVNGLVRTFNINRNASGTSAQSDFVASNSIGASIGMGVLGASTTTVPELGKANESFINASAISKIINIGADSGIFISSDATATVNTYFDNVNKRVGIGTNVPAKRLHVDANNDSLRFSNLNGTGNTLLIDATGNVYRGTADASINAIRNISATTTVLLTDATILADASAVSVTVNLPAIATVPVGKKYTIKKVDATVNAIIIDGNGAETIDGNATATTTNPYETIIVQTNGTEWFIIN